MLGATNIAKNTDKEKWVYSDYGIAFDGAGSQNFGNDNARNVVIFGFVNSSAESRVVSFKGNEYDTLVDYSAIDKSDILNIYKYLMVKNYIR